MGTGNYPDRMTWLVRSTTTDTTNGQPVESFTPSGSLWCRVEETNGRRQRDYGVEQPGADAVIYVRNYPNLSALDRLQSLQWGDIFQIEHVHRGKNELVIQAFKIDNPTFLADGVVEHDEDEDE